MLLKMWLYDNLGYDLQVDEKTIIFGLYGEDETTTVLNYVIIHAKYFININRLKENHILSMPTFKSILKYNLEIEQRIVQTNYPQKFHKFLPLLDLL